MSHVRKSSERAYLRHPAEMPIHVHCEHASCQNNHRMHNVCKGGLACRSDAPLPVGAEVSICIPVGHPPFEVPGEVVWCRRISETCYELGLRFTSAEDAFAARMVEQLCHIERYRHELAEKEGRVIDAETAAAEWIAKFARHFPRIN